ncbi:MAG: type II secretion system protein [bacterium]|nr:type II secretion system protein [bacterium]
MKNKHKIPMKRLKRDANAARGATLVEALISVGIMSFVIVSILSGFSQQQMTTRNTAAKNMAVRLGEMRMEEVLKFSGEQLQANAGTIIDYVMVKPNSYEVVAVNPNEQKQYRRTININMDFMGDLATIIVTVDYPMTGTSYPFQLVIKSRRSQR